MYYLGKMKKKLFKNRFLIIIVLVSFLVTLPLFKQGYFTHHDDLHFIRVYEMRKCFSDLQIPCRWNPDMAYGYGQPMFNYYSVFPYYLGTVFSYFGYLFAVKLLFFIPLFVGGVFMFVFARQLMGRYGALTASVLYALAPYRALDVYVRGNVAESFAIVLVPLIFYFSLRVIKKYSLINFIGLVVTLSVFLITHNISILITLPVFFLWLLLILFLNKFSNLIKLIIGLLLSFLISSFFILPAYFEKGLVKSETLVSNYLDFRIHFVSLKQMFFDRLWGYGVSVAGAKDTMSFQLGWPHVFLVFLSVFPVLFLFFKKKFNKRSLPQGFFTKNVYYYAYFVIVFFGSIFMMHFKSAFLWEKLPIIWFIQFPWRFLILVIFAESILGGYLITLIDKPLKYYLAYLIVFLTIILNLGYFKPGKYIKVSSQEKLSGGSFIEQQKGAVLDYLPQTAKKPVNIAPSQPYFEGGTGSILSYKRTSNTFLIDLLSEDDNVLVILVFDFPVWNIYLDGKLIKHEVSEAGLIKVEVNKGTHQINGRFVNTKIRSISNFLTLIGLFSFLFFIYHEKSKRFSN